MSSINTESRVYVLTGLTPILGSLPAAKELRANRVTVNAPTKQDAEAENFPFDSAERGLTIFSRNRQDQLCLMAYQVKGFFKAALYALSGQYKITAYKSKVDLMLFVEPRFIPLIRDGKTIQFEDEILERPLRSSGPKGDRVSLAASEQVNDPWSVEIEITLLPPKAAAAGTTGTLLTWEVVEAALDYGSYHGLGQWRNADYGRFIWTRKE